MTIPVIYYKVIIFCSNKLEGTFRFEDKWQIYPLKSDHSPFNKVVQYHPVVLEFFVEANKEVAIPKAFEEHREMIVKMTSQGNKIKEITTLLTAFSNYRFYANTVKAQYFIESVDGHLPPPEDDHASKVGYNIYTYPEFRKTADITELTKVDFPEVTEVDHKDYFIYFDNTYTEVVKFPNTLYPALNNYHTLKDDKQKTVYASLSLIGNGVELSESMRSLSFISLVSSIETMVNLEYSDLKVERCDACGAEKYRVFAKFRDFLLRYVSENEKTKKDIDKIYNVRSKIAHAGQLFLGDNTIDWSDEETQNKEGEVHIQTMQVARMSVMNWVLMRAEPPKDKNFPQAVVTKLDPEK
jgi:hypothetical protein